MDELFDSETPPTIQRVGTTLVLDFTRNPGAQKPFYDWLRAKGSMGDAWPSFGDWFDHHASKYEDQEGA